MADWFQLILMGFICFSLGMGVMNLICNYVDGFVMTKNLTEESRILELCINVDMYIPEPCELIYGGKNYGDRIQ